MTVYLGTSGWQYRHWRGRFYPRAKPAAEWLPFYAARFGSVELNSTFYRLPERETFAAWAAATPDDFVVAMKASRYLSHVRRLRDPGEPVRLMLERAAGLGSRLGPVLLQLPPTLHCRPELLDAALAAFPPDRRVAVEFRDDTWFVDAVRETLVRHGVALCLVDRNEQMLTPSWRTADWTYVRFHEGRGIPRSSYRAATLRRWADRLADLWSDADEVYVYFNNDSAGCALRDAIRFGEILDRLGRRRTRTPGTEDVQAG